MWKRTIEKRVNACLSPVHGGTVTEALESALAATPFPRLYHADSFLFLRGYPVAPWIPFKPADVVWRVWLQRLRDLHTLWRESEPSPTALPEWPSWSGNHVSLINARTAEEGVEKALESIRLLDLLPGARIHVVGHSVGAHAAIRLLNTYRRSPSDIHGSVGSVVSLDAALNPAAWLRSVYAPASRRTPREEFDGLGAWTASHDLGFIQVTNTSDWWTYGKLADGPYLPVKSDHRVGLFDQLSGAGHDLIRQWVELPETLWR